ncbi:PAS domain-containing protein [Rhodobacteraceae bacterium 2376]|uniref:histidine kinase n=1 Tax=Rhabdonatronobacter sediminivivens TaxID=2743469 RepID=A0A7Z0I0P8_9RHOB|nr:PAS domain-containing protein [Rhabdonatronobacter sediminivivens]NYS25502.1 PAS domain-containing protein [Rhabdonatronobacter sediminivivens]
MAEALPQIVWTTGPDGAVDWVSHEFRRYTGITDAGFADGDLLPGLHPEDRAPTRENWSKALSGGHSCRTEFRLWCAAEARWRLHRVHVRPYSDEAGLLTRWYGIATDIHDLREAEDARETELRLLIVERRVLEQIAAGEPLSRILQDICTAMPDVLGGARANVALVSGDERCLDTFIGDAALEAWSRAVGQIPIAEGQGSCGTGGARREAVYSADIARDPLWQPYRELAAAHGLAACWSQPVLDGTGHPIAIFCCYHSEPKAPSKAQMAILQRMADAVHTAISQVASRDQLQASERRYRSLFDFLPIAIWEQDISGVLKSLDALKATGVTDFEAWLDRNPAFASEAMAAIRVLDGNRAARQLHGAMSDDPRSISQALVSLANEPKFRMALRAMLVAAWEGQTQLETTYTASRSDGTTADILARLLLPEPGSGRLLLTEDDITEQRRVEERFRHVAQRSSDFIFDRDLVTDLTWVNDAATWLPDFTPGEKLLPRSAWVESVHPEDEERILTQIEAAIQGGQDFWEGEYRLRKRDGDFIPVRERASILHDDAGVPVRMIGNIIDLSEQKALEAQLRQSQRLDAVGQLTGGIAHDFNNLLTVILGNAETLAGKLPADRPSAAMARQIVSAAEQAAELTQRLLAFARKQPLSPGAYDVNELIEGMQMLIERSMTPAIALDLRLAEDPGAVHVDRALFESALLNLCVNARDAMPMGGLLRIETSLVSLAVGAALDAPEPGEYVRISVSDTGEGMDNETLARVFEPFFTTKPVGEGSGLGLSMVHGFVYQSGGHIDVHSELGAGTTVELMLPRQARQEGGRESPQGDTTPRKAKKRMRVLVVEDEDQVREYICMLLKSLEYKVEAEARATSALARLRADEPFDLLISDVVMPGGIDGRQLAETILEERPELPILLVSGHSEEIATSGGKLDPRISFLRKPFRRSTLQELLQELLRG